MRFIRFVLARRNADSGVDEGVFALAYELRHSAFLETPTRFNRTTSKGFYRRNTRGIAWFKDTAAEHLARMHKIKAVLERHGHVVVMLSESKVGYVVHDDAFQVIAEPFSDTQTR